MAADEMARAETLPQLDASTLVDGGRLEAEAKDMYRRVAREDRTGRDDARAGRGGVPRQGSIDQADPGPGARQPVRRAGTHNPAAHHDRVVVHYCPHTCRKSRRKFVPITF